MIKNIMLVLVLLLSIPAYAGSCSEQIGMISGLSDVTKQKNDC